MNVKIPVSKHANIANYITSFGVLLGFLSLVFILEGSVRTGLTLYLITILTDRIDGVVARKLNAESEFGKELDSLADALNFSFIPAVTAYVSGFNSWWMILILAVYMMAGVWRLAHFNMKGVEESDGKHYYSGLPTTFAGAWFLLVAAVCLLLVPDLFIVGMLSFFIPAAVLMVSSFRYNKNGFPTKAITLLTPLSVIAMWLV